MVYDSAHDQVILFGGDYVKANNATWIYNYSDNTWMNMTPAVQATVGGGHSMVYDSTYDQVILFGEPNNGKTWIYKITEKYFQQGIFDSIITTFDDLYKISGEIT